MRAALLSLAVLSACAPRSGPDELATDTAGHAPLPPPTTTADAPPAPPAGPPIAATELAGTWNYEVRAMNGDSVLATGQYIFNDDASTVQQTSTSGGEPAEGTVTLSGSEVRVRVGPYSSYLRSGATVTSTATYRLEGGRLVGIARARYDNVATADSVVQLRVTMTKAP
jgi:hypothetical protein